MNKLSIKRPIVVKSVITEKFLMDVKSSNLKEIDILNSQIATIQLQINQIQQQISQHNLKQNAEVIGELNRNLFEWMQKLDNIVLFKQELINKLADIELKPLGDTIVTGQLESYVDISVGDSLYDVYDRGEIIIKDGIVVEIKL